MSFRDSPIGDIKVPLTWSAGAALVIAFVIAGALLLTHQHDMTRPGAYDGARRAIDEVAGPVGGVISAPIRWVDGVAGDVSDYFDAASQNRQLKAELVQARGWRDQLVALQVENARLRAVLGIRTDPPLPHVAADTVADVHGPFANTRLANVGSDQGVTEGNPVVSEHGLVGRVVGVTSDVSRVMLLTDVDSHTPVTLLRTNGRAILSGDGGGSPKLDYVRSAQAIREGDRVMTSGDGGVFPRGLPVGTVVKGSDGAWRVALDSDAAPIDYVQILLFTNFSQIANAQALAPKDLPTAMTEEPSQSIVGPIAGPTSPKPASASPEPAKPSPATPAKRTTAAAPATRPHAVASRAARPPLSATTTVGAAGD